MIVRKEKEIGGRQLIIETGRLAKQANGAVTVQYGDTVILVAVTASKKPREGIDFFPLSVEYQERTYAAGKIPGGFFKREGRPSGGQILSARLIDRPIRPLFPKNFRNETQVVIYVLSSDLQNPADVLGGIGASAALSLSDIPFEGPTASVRVGRIDGQLIVNPTIDQIAECELNLIVAGTSDSLMMVEGESEEISEKEMLEALEFGHQHVREIIDLQKEILAELSVTKTAVEADEDSADIVSQVESLAADKIRQAIRISEKQARNEQLSAIGDEIQEKLAESFEDSESAIKGALEKLIKREIRGMMISDNVRLDGRQMDDIRDISCEVSFLPRTHGSALFTRGQTQSLGTTTLGTKGDEQIIDSLESESRKSYMLHYNFPGFSVGEAKPFRGVSRREVGHGDLAERALKPVLPADESFPYTLRVVSEILESNGSSSMASVCSGSLSLMDAGVPIKSHVAGIAMGLIKEDNEVRVLTDILGDEDHFGDMDFKVAGTREGITAFQMDIKISGITFEVMSEALERAHRARQSILDKMDKAIARPRAEISPYAPRIESIMIPQDKIGAVIGPGGKVIRHIVEETGAKIDIDDTGMTIVSAVDLKALTAAKQMIEGLIADPEPGTEYMATVKRIMDFGAFAEFLPGKEGLIHISELDVNRVGKVTDVVQLGDKLEVVLKRVDREGRFNLSRKEFLVRHKKNEE